MPPKISRREAILATAVIIALFALLAFAIAASIGLPGTP